MIFKFANHYNILCNSSLLPSRLTHFLPFYCNMMELKGAKMNISRSFSLTHKLMHSWDIRLEIYLQFYIFYNI